MRIIGINFRRSFWCRVTIEIFWYYGAYGYDVYYKPSKGSGKVYKNDAHKFLTDPLLFIGIIIK